LEALSSTPFGITYIRFISKKLAKLIVNEGQKLLGGVWISVLNCRQNARDFGHGQPPAVLGIPHDNRPKPMNKVRWSHRRMALRSR
jgi:hypothetical protein